MDFQWTYESEYIINNDMKNLIVSKFLNLCLYHSGQYPILFDLENDSVSLTAYMKSLVSLH